jgi:hypothetical protein
MTPYGRTIHGLWSGGWHVQTCGQHGRWPARPRRAKAQPGGSQRAGSPQRYCCRKSCPTSRRGGEKSPAVCRVKRHARQPAALSKIMDGIGLGLRRHRVSRFTLSESSRTGKSLGNARGADYRGSRWVFMSSQGCQAPSIIRFQKCSQQLNTNAQYYSVLTKKPRSARVTLVPGLMTTTECLGVVVTCLKYGVGCK